MKINVLVTGCAGEIAISILDILEENFSQCAIFGCDIKPVSSCEHNFSETFQISPAKSASWKYEIAEIVERNEIDLIIPTVEHELFQLGEMFSKDGRIIIQPHEILKICLDKYNTYKFLVKKGIRVAQTALLKNALLTNEPMIVKPRSGRGSKGLKITKSKKDLELLKSQLQGTAWVCQELLLPENMELTCGLYRTYKEEIRSITLRRNLKNGMTHSGEVFEDKRVSLLLEDIAIALDLKGSINVQCILTKSGPCVFEINPRFSSTVRFRHLLGFQDLKWSMQEALGIELDTYEKPKPGIKFIREDKEMILKGEKW